MSQLVPSTVSNAVAEIFSQGDEVLTGQIADTNAAWLARAVTRLGFDVIHHSAVGDRLEPMVEQLRVIAGRSDLCIGTGGLGPTVDDLTAAAVATAFDRPLALDPVALEQVEAYFARRGHTMAEVNRKQAWLPSGSQRLDNHWGTAPGFLVRQERCLFVFLPGVPSEMQAMFTHGVEARIIESYRLQPPRVTVLRTFGLGESALQQKLEPLGLPPGVRLGFRAGVYQNEVKLSFPWDFPARESEALVARAAALIGDGVFAIGDVEAAEGSLAAVVGKCLAARGATLATAETFTAGQLAWLCRGQGCLLHSAVAPRSEPLFRLLGAEPGERFSDPQVDAVSLAGRLRSRCGADYALAILGSPTQDSVERLPPPATVAIALAGPLGSSVRALTLAGTAERRQMQAAAAALDDLRRHLMQESRCD
ncbi:CinA family nicotinamide mononucleotide deamidase-related protein [Methylotetracoccus oryzae]|uniref:CinA family nicotinamide mononucleotide deamidase-related protein n=1 Tax=Methylotetracoccus oryzae TaxID=1919059 RepID=UPI00111AD517|nr:CinA family nicotinamide mononucleotide deamidase-related protein [Methylotetracoccus oryzae]